MFAGVGIASHRASKGSVDDYLIGGRSIHPALAALSAVSTWNSGYMFLGIIGFTWLLGYSIVWILIMSITGEMLAWKFILPYIRADGEKRGVRSLSSFISEVKGSPEAKLAAIFTVIFLSIYAAAQLTAGGKALFALLDWPIWIGIILGGVLVAAYCYAGGIRASIWTDSVQSVTMVVGGVTLCVTVMMELGGFSGLNSTLTAVDPSLTSLLPPGLGLGLTMWIAAFVVGGLGVAGQPHVISRILTLASDEDLKIARIWFFVYQVPFVAMMMLVGLGARALYSADGVDPELGLLIVAMDLLNPLMVGMILASIFAATMSTADSQVLACTAAITEDINQGLGKDKAGVKKVTLLMALFITMVSLIALAIPGGDSVFVLVIIAVYTLGAIFVPLIIIRLIGYKPDSKHAIIMMLTSFLTVLTWRSLGLNHHVFESIPGMGAAFTAHIIMAIRADNSDTIFGRYATPTRKQIFTILAILMLPVAAIETTYILKQPTRLDSVNSGEGWQMNFTITGTAYDFEEWVADGTTNTYSLERGADDPYLSMMYLEVKFDESNEPFISNACDEVTISMNFDGVQGPLDSAPEEEVMLDSCDDQWWSVMQVTPDQRITDLISAAEGGDGNFTLSGTHDELYTNKSILEGDQRNVGVWETDVRVDVNKANPLNSDGGETVHLRWWIFEISTSEPVLTI
jgi:sodium/proline symporter